MRRRRARTNDRTPSTTSRRDSFALRPGLYSVSIPREVRRGLRAGAGNLGRPMITKTPKDAADGDNVVVRVENLVRRFNVPGGEVLAVDGVSFVVRAGECYGLLGPNGAGKTTTLRIILGLLRPTAGQAFLAGHRATDSPELVKRSIGLVSTTAGLYQHLSVREMLLFFADLYDVPADSARRELSRLADLLGLTELLDRRCATLSTGRKQRVNLARALIHRP